MKEQQTQILRDHSRKLVRELGIIQLADNDFDESPQYWHALIEISTTPGITISKLGNVLLISNSKISRLITYLQKKGLVDIKDTIDKRQKSLHITNDGHDEIKKIDAFSKEKINGAFELLTQEQIEQITNAIAIYGEALQKSRELKDAIKINKLSTSRSLRKRIVKMIADIQKNEFLIPITHETNISVLKAEEHFCYNNSCNFWYALDGEGEVIGSVGLKKIDENYAEVKKFFVAKNYRSRGVAQKLMLALLKAALKHNFKFLVLGTVNKLKAAHKFYEKYGFHEIAKEELPQNFELCPLDSLFFLTTVEGLKKIIL